MVQQYCVNGELLLQFFSEGMEYTFKDIAVDSTLARSLFHIDQEKTHRWSQGLICGKGFVDTGGFLFNRCHWMLEITPLGLEVFLFGYSYFHYRI